MQLKRLRAADLIRFKLIAIASIFTGAVFFGWLFQPTKVIDVHYSKKFDNYFVIVEHFPLTRNNKIRWWEENKSLFKEKYHVPIGECDYGISFWVGNYKTDSGTDQDSDLLCFDEMITKKNCIEKDHRPMKIWYRKDKNETIYLFN